MNTEDMLAMLQDKLPEKVTRLERVVCAVIVSPAMAGSSLKHTDALVEYAKKLCDQLDLASNPAILDEPSFPEVTPDQFPTFNEQRVILTRQQFDDFLREAIAAQFNSTRFTEQYRLSVFDFISSVFARRGQF